MSTRRKMLNLIVTLLALAALVVSIAGQAVMPTMAMPMDPTDETKVPHYFGPNPNWANSPFTLPAITVTINGDGAGAKAAATVGANGAITDITITDPGSGYTTATVDITGAGTGATATVTVATSGSVTAIEVTNAGAGYTAPTVTISGGGGTGVLTQAGNALIERAYATDYEAVSPVRVLVIVPTPLPSGTLKSFLALNQATAGSSPTPSAGQSFNAYVLRPLPNNQYQIIFDSGQFIVPALADPSISEAVTYAVPDTAVQAGDVIGFYGSGVPVDITAAGADVFIYPAPAAPVQGATITVGSPEFPLFGQARTYSFAANVVDTTAVVPLQTATATAYGGVDQIAVTNAGSGYTMPTVDFDLPDDPAGTQARGHAEFDPATGAITAVVVDDPGSGYATAPNVVIRDGTLFDPINNGGAGATAAATLRITGIVVDNFGSGYVSAPTVTINDPNGTGATATAQVNGGSVTAITLGNAGSGYVTSGGIRKFVDSLPGLCLPPACPTSGKYIPLAVPEAKNYNGVEADEYVIGLVQYRTSFSSDLPPTLVRGYVQLETPANASISQHFALTNASRDAAAPDTPVLINGSQAYAVTPPQYLGPVIGATKNKPVRIVFYNLLPNGAAGDLFLPVDSSLMGSGMGPMEMMAPMNEGTVMDEVRNPMCSEYPKMMGCFRDNRATLHLHGGISPWISDGTAHQWITPADEMTDWPQGVSVANVPDMAAAGCDGTTDGCMTFYYTNQQSARLLFYHDHAWGITRLNVYAGEAAGYLITDDTEKSLLTRGLIPADQIPLIIQDKTFVPSDAQLYNQVDPTTGEVISYGQDPTWDKAHWGGEGSLWNHHVYMPAQNPGDPGGMSAYGRWMYGPWFWPPAANTVYGPIANPYYDPNCNLDDPATWQYQIDPFCEPQQIPGTPNISVGMEQFNDTPIVNGVAYPTLNLEPKSYRLRILSAANDRFFNFQWYVGDPSTASTGLNSDGQVIGATEVALNLAELAAAQTNPNVFPTPVQSAATQGPDWIQIGTEGGFLPAPVVVDGQQPTTWVTDPTRFDVGNVDQHSLLLAPAERADVIVDFSKFAGKTLILYNDAPAAFPARVPSYDYYTGAPDLSPVGAPTILPGYGPNSRTIMQVKIANTTAAPTFNLTNLVNAFKHNANGTGVFESGQHPIIVGQAAYNSAYGTNFATSSNCNAPGSTLQRCDGLVRVNDTLEFGFNTLRAPTVKLMLPLQPKAIHDEMNATTFDEYGRMQANLGVEAQPPTPGQQNVTLYPFVNPATEIIDGTNLPKAHVLYDQNGLPVSDVKVTAIVTNTDGTQIWRVTHNGVDTHPIHFHLYDVQVVNRVTWDNIIIPADATELGWKDTVRMAPLEDTIVALRPIIPEVPWELPNAIRMLNPMMPAGSTAMFNNINPQGNPTAQIVNQLVNFGWEYVYHCHILSHEEMDMMRPVSVALPPVKPDGLAATIDTTGANPTVNLSWNDNSIAETAYVVQRMTGVGTWVDVGTSPSPLDQVNTTGIRTFVDTTAQWGTIYQYQIVAQNSVGYGHEFPVITVKSTSNPLTVDTSAPPLPAAPTNLVATAVSANQVNLTWVDTAITETGFDIQRCTGVGCTDFASLGSVGADVTAYNDATAAPNTTYRYQVLAFNQSGNSQPSNIATATTLSLGPAVPTNLVPSLLNNPLRARLTWTDNSNNENLFQVWRSTNGGAFTLVGTVNRTAAQRTATGGAVAFTHNAVAGDTYAYYVIAVNTVPNPDEPSAASSTVTIAVAIPAAPSNLLATAASSTQVNLTWTDNSNNEAGFTIQRATNPNFTGATNVNVGVNVTSYSDTGRTANTTYYYRVRSRNVIGNSAWSNSASATTPAAAGAPAAPTSFAGTGINNGATASVNMTWIDNATDETRYVLQGADNATFTAGLVSWNLAANLTTFADTGLGHGASYYYRIRAENASGVSAWVNLTPFPIVTP